MSKNLSAKYYKEIKKDYKKKLVKDIKIFPKKKKKKNDNMVVNVTKISQKVKKNKLVEYRKRYYRTRKKDFIIIIRKCFNLENFAFL